MIMMRTLHRDISKYNQLETAEEAQEETGWKLVSSTLLASLSLQADMLHSVGGAEGRLNGSVLGWPAAGAGWR